MSDNEIIANGQRFTGSDLSIRGDHNTVIGTGCTVHGNHNNVKGSGNNVFGNHNIVQGCGNDVVGNRNRLSGVDNTARGRHNNISGLDNHANDSSHTSVTTHTRVSSSSTTTTSSITVGGVRIIGNPSSFGNIPEFLAGSGITVLQNYHGGMLIQGERRTSTNRNDSRRQATMATRSRSSARNSPLAVSNNNNNGNSSTHPSFSTRVTRSRAAAFSPRQTNTPHHPTVKCPTAEEEQHDKPAGASSCIICQDRAPICIALPCLHLSYCVACARSMARQPPPRVTCAKCRQPVESLARVFAE